MPIPDSELFRMAFHETKTVAPTPLDRSILRSLYSEGSFTEGELHTVHGCYLQLEQDARDLCVNQFKQGEGSHLVWDINIELWLELREWRSLWKKHCMADEDYNGAMDMVHSQWAAQTIGNLKHELYLLSSTRRSNDYITFVEACRVEVPLP